MKKGLDQYILHNEPCLKREVRDDNFCGDINGDGFVDVLDIILMINHIVGTDTLTFNQLCRADINGDSDSPTVLDIVPIVQHLIGNSTLSNDCLNSNYCGSDELGDLTGLNTLYMNYS